MSFVHPALSRGCTRPRLDSSLRPSTSETHAAHRLLQSIRTASTTGTGRTPPKWVTRRPKPPRQPRFIGSGARRRIATHLVKRSRASELCPNPTNSDTPRRALDVRHPGLRMNERDERAPETGSTPTSGRSRPACASRDLEGFGPCASAKKCMHRDTQGAFHLAIPLSGEASLSPDCPQPVDPEAGRLFDPHWHRCSKRERRLRRLGRRGLAGCRRAMSLSAYPDTGIWITEACDRSTSARFLRSKSAAVRC